MRSSVCQKFCGVEPGSALLFSQSAAPEWWRRRDPRDVSCLPGILGLRTPLLSFAAQTLLRAHHSPEDQVSESRIRKGH